MNAARALGFVLILASICMPVQPAWAQSGAKKERDAASPAGQLSQVGKGEHMGRKALQPGAYISSRHRAAAQSWMAAHPVGGGRAAAATWEIGQALPGAALLQPAPGGLVAVLPKPPPGTRYVMQQADVLLIAANSRMVVDAVPAKP